MQVEKILDDKLKREYNITVPAANINSKIEEKIISISKKVKMPGFREGKVPLDVVRKKYGKEVLGEVLQDIVASSSSKAISDNQLRPATQPAVQVLEFDEGKDLKYKLSIEVFPEVPEFDVTKLKLRTVKAEIVDTDTDELQKLVASNYKDFQPLKSPRPAKKGDMLVIDFKGFVDGNVLDKGDATNFRVELGTGTLIKDFEDNLEGKEAGTEFKINVKFPEGYHNAELSNKDATFEIKLHEILEPAATAITDEFAKKIGFEDISKLREALKKQLESDAEAMSRIIAKKELFDILDKEVNYELPEKMVTTEVHNIIHEIEKDQQSLPEDQRKTHKQLHEEYEPLAKRRVKLGILITEVGRKNKVEITQEDLRKAMSQEVMRFPGQEQQVIDFYRNNPQAQENLKGPIIEEKVVDLIFEKAKPKEEKTTLEALRKLVLENNI